MHLIQLLCSRVALDGAAHGGFRTAGRAGQNSEKSFSAWHAWQGAEAAAGTRIAISQESWRSS